VHKIYFDGEVAARYDADSTAVFAPDVLDPTVSPATVELLEGELPP
jgi:hypothetical protein